MGEGWGVETEDRAMKVDERPYMISRLVVKTPCVDCEAPVVGWCGWKIDAGPMCDACTAEADRALGHALAAVLLVRLRGAEFTLVTESARVKRSFVRRHDSEH